MSKPGHALLCHIQRNYEEGDLIRLVLIGTNVDVALESCNLEDGLLFANTFGGSPVVFRASAIQGILEISSEGEEE